jgi:hypothetical protein
VTGQRRGATLVEVLVGAGLLLIVMTGSFTVLHMGGRARGVTASAESLRTALAVQERIEADLASLVRVDGQTVRWWSDRRARLAFYVFDPEPARGASPDEVGVRAVRYALARPGQMLRRESGGREGPVGSTPLTAIEFLPFTSPTGPLLRVNITIARGPDEPAGPPLTHTFLARIPAPRGARGVSVAIRSDFSDPADAESESDELP